jgi:ABC-type branched-subunit amino acid transport system substrate-binding protein
MRPRTTRTVRLVAILSCVVVGSAACGSNGSKAPVSTGASGTVAPAAIPAGPIKLGLSAPMSGPLALYGKVIKGTDQAAVDYVNSAFGGIAGHPIQLVTVDDQNNATTAVQAAEQLVNAHVAGVIGDGIDPIDLQEAPVFNKAKIPTVTFNSVSSASDNPYVFSDSAESRLFANVAAKLITTQKLSNVAFLNDGSPLAKEQIADIVGDLQSHSPPVKIVANEVVPTSSLDLTPMLSKLRSEGAQTIYFNFTSQVEGPFFKALQTLGWSPKLVATDAVYYIGFGDIGNLGQGGYTICATGANTNLASGVVGLIQKDTKILPTPQQVLEARENLANILVLKYGIEKAKSLDGPAVKAAIETITNQSFGADDWKYTFSSSQHNGYLSFHVCQLTPLGRYSSDVALPDSVWQG